MFLDCKLKIRIPVESLPVEWPEAKEYGQMTYNKWLRYFESYGFIVYKNEVLDPSIHRCPQLIAALPKIGLQVTITFSVSIFKVKAKKNKSDAIMYCEITLI